MLWVLFILISRLSECSADTLYLSEYDLLGFDLEKLKYPKLTVQQHCSILTSHRLVA